MKKALFVTEQSTLRDSDPVEKLPQSLATCDIAEIGFEQEDGGIATQSLTATSPAQGLEQESTVDTDSSEKEEEDGHRDSVANAFDELTRESNFRHLHQIAGWVDLEDKSTWDAYVTDVMDGKLRPGDRLFEAGCGVLAFLKTAMELTPNLTIGGVDGAKKTIELVKTQLVEPEFRDNFFVGMLPDCLGSIPDNTWDVVVCNSVFQYLQDEEQARRAAAEMLRIAKRWVIVADVCDAKFAANTQRVKSSMAWTANLPDYRSYSKRFWEDHFENGEHLVSVRHVQVPQYARRKQRYVVYIEKNAPVALPDDDAEP